jgi:Ca2+-binding RTX toxin-like protein
VTTLWIDTNNVAGAELQINLTGTFAASSFTVTDNLDGRSSITRTSALTVTGTAGNDTLTGGSDNDTLDGLAGHDTLDGGAGNDSLIGGSGDDWFVAGAGADTLDGGSGYDRANYVGATAGIVVNLATGTASSDGSGSADTLVGIERVMGSNFADSITGSGADDDFSGNLGNDTLDGGAGFDFVWYGGATAAVQIDLQAGTATGGEGNDQLISIEGIAGSRYADNLQGSAVDNYFRGDGGLTDLVGGNDTINGQGGFDVVDYRDDPAAVTVNLQTKIAQDGRGGQDSITSIEEVRGSNFNDSITGSTELWFERFEGRDGNDTIDGGAVTDTVEPDQRQPGELPVCGCSR